MGGRLAGVCRNMLTRALISRATEPSCKSLTCHRASAHRTRYERQKARQQRKAVLTVQRRAGKGRHHQPSMKTISMMGPE